VHGEDSNGAVRCFAARDLVVERRNNYRDGMINGQRSGSAGTRTTASPRGGCRW
jgi:hypothetical protein